MTNETITLPALLLEKEVAEYLRCSPAKLANDRWNGVGVPYVKIGRAVRYRAADVLAIIESQRG